MVSPTKAKLLFRGEPDAVRMDALIVRIVNAVVPELPDVKVTVVGLKL
jgi:hypothetical protein